MNTTLSKSAQLVYSVIDPAYREEFRRIIEGVDVSFIKLTNDVVANFSEENIANFEVALSGIEKRLLGRTSDKKKQLIIKNFCRKLRNSVS